MKIALYMEDGLEQIVLTPDTSFERQMLGKLADGTRVLRIKRGGFYACQGGWTRQHDGPTDSVMLVLEAKEQAA